MQNVSATGLKARIVSLPTFPSGFDITQFADDTDPFSSENVDVADTGVALNGDLVPWSKPSKITATIGVLPGTQEAKNLDTLLIVNRATKGKLSAQDVVTLVVTYPNGSTKVGMNGVIVSGPPVDSGSSEGRLKTREYTFHFENVV